MDANGGARASGQVTGRASKIIGAHGRVQKIIEMHLQAVQLYGYPDRGPVIPGVPVASPPSCPDHNQPLAPDLADSTIHCPVSASDQSTRCDTGLDCSAWRVSSLGFSRGSAVALTTRRSASANALFRSSVTVSTRSMSSP